jgi:hypothetical protein
MPEKTHAGSRRTSRAIRIMIATLLLLAIRVWRYLVPRRSEQTPEPALAGSHTIQRERPETAFEASDWNLVPVATVFVGTLILLVVSCFVLIAAYPSALPDVARSVRIAPPGPRLLTNPASEFKRVRAREDKKLNTYYWINKPKGIVHIPIEQAMRKLARSGIAGFGKAQQ